MKSKILLGVLFCAIFSMSAQVKKWTLEECVLYAVENNLTIEQFELDLENAKIDKSDAIGSLLPDLNSNNSFSSNTGFSINPTNNLPTNQTQNSVNLGVTSSVTLFDGLRNIKQIQRAEINAIANQYRLEDLKDDIRLSVAQAYLSVISNKEALKVAKAQYAVTKQDLERTKELVESGVVPRGDLLEIEATAATQEQQIVSNEALVTISRLNLAQLLQITDYDNFDVVDQDFSVPPSNILNNSPKSIFAKAMEFRNDIKLSQANVDLAEKDLEIARGAYLPTIGAFFNYGTRYSDVALIPVAGLGPDVPPQFFTPSFKDQLWIFDGISYGAQLNIPIFNGWNTRNNVKRSKITLERNKLQFELDKLDLEATVQQAYVDVTTFGKTYEAAEKTLEAREIAYQYAKDRFDVGLLNAFDFGQSQARLDDARANVIRSKYDYIFRLKILEFYFGLPIQLN